MMRKVKTYTNPNESAFLGLFEGKKKQKALESDSRNSSLGEGKPS